MRLVFGLVLVLGIGLAGFAVYMVKGYVDGYQNALATERANAPKIVPTVEVYVANQQLRYGDVLSDEAVTKVSWPKNALPEGIFVEGDEENVLFEDDARFVLPSRRWYAGLYHQS